MVNVVERFTQIQIHIMWWNLFVTTVKVFLKRVKELQYTRSSFSETELCWDFATHDAEELIKKASFISFADTSCKSYGPVVSNWVLRPIFEYWLDLWHFPLAGKISCLLGLFENDRERLWQAMGEGLKGSLGFLHVLLLSMDQDHLESFRYVGDCCQSHPK